MSNTKFRFVVNKLIIHIIDTKIYIIKKKEINCPELSHFDHWVYRSNLKDMRSEDGELI